MSKYIGQEPGRAFLFKGSFVGHNVYLDENTVLESIKDKELTFTAHDDLGYAYTVQLKLEYLNAERFQKEWDEATEEIKA